MNRLDLQVYKERLQGGVESHAYVFDDHSAYTASRLMCCLPFFKFDILSVFGCEDLPAPENGQGKRTDDVMVFSCHGSDLEWQLECRGDEWHGPNLNCSAGGKSNREYTTMAKWSYTWLIHNPPFNICIALLLRTKCIVVYAAKSCFAYFTGIPSLMSCVTVPISVLLQKQCLIHHSMYLHNINQE